MIPKSQGAVDLRRELPLPEQVPHNAVPGKHFLHSGKTEYHAKHR